MQIGCTDSATDLLLHHVIIFCDINKLWLLNCGDLYLKYDLIF